MCHPKNALKFPISDSICGFFYDIPLVVWPGEGVVPGPGDFDGKYI